MDTEKLKKTLREIDSRIHNMQQQLDELHDMSYQIREIIMDEEDKKRAWEINNSWIYNTALR